MSVTPWARDATATETEEDHVDTVQQTDSSRGDDPGPVADALLLVDLQLDYLSDEGLAQRRPGLTRAANELLSAARSAGVLRVEAVTEHAHDGSTWALNMRDDGVGIALAGTPGADPLPELDREGVLTVRKTRDSAFHRTDLADLLAQHGVRRLVVVGVSTECCVSATASDAYAHDLRVLLPEDATASPDPQRHRAALDELHTQYRQPVVTAADVAQRWRAHRSCADLLHAAGPD